MFVVFTIMFVFVDFTVWGRVGFEVTFGTGLGVVGYAFKVIVEDFDAEIDCLELGVTTGVLINEVPLLVLTLLLHGFTGSNGVVVGLTGLVLVFLGVGDVFLKLHLVRIFAIHLLLVLHVLNLDVDLPLGKVVSSLDLTLLKVLNAVAHVLLKVAE